MKTLTNNLQIELSGTNLDYQKLLVKASEVFEKGDHKLYQKLLDEAEDLARYIRELAKEI